VYKITRATINFAKMGQCCQQQLLPQYTVHRITKKTVQNFFCHKFVKCLPNLIIFGTRIAQRIGLCEVH